ncbi:uncharacterized protein N7515_002072 [Penicillium bovifimosum]|uniref:Uncharacterized protein n=1 Tax=Penicillium bovifimosum TaxID=126998 RepID=A0A9W9HAX1_9EURO|nr:uncharacterized protein N7515_002072 [Penicillium bovifimosum]KAJ5143285.1 hypothetical protein N7515_002072 [Penicillium bovifimosum]
MSILQPVSYPLGDIRALRKYAFAVIRQSSSDGPTVTKHGLHYLRYEGIRLSSAELGGFLRRYTIETSNALIDLVFGFANWERITRDLNIAEVGRREDWSRPAADFGMSDASSPFFDFLALHAFGPAGNEWLLESNAATTPDATTPEINRGTAATERCPVEGCQAKFAPHSHQQHRGQLRPIHAFRNEDRARKSRMVTRSFSDLVDFLMRCQRCRIP